MNKQLFLKELEKRRPSIFENYNHDQLPEIFKGTDTLTIECKKHGVFQQRAYTHLYGQGCTICGRIKTIAARTVTAEQFIQRSMAKFSNKFNYSKTKYIKKGIALTITCPEHGDFTIRPETHLWLPYGCPDCNVTMPKEVKQLVKVLNGDLIVIPHSYFDQDSIEKYLIYKLKNIYRCWFIVNNEIKVFKNELQACKFFNVRKDLLLRNLTSELRMTVPNFQVLF